MEGFSVQTVDTTGAGDAFVGALLVSIAQDPSIFQVPSLPFFSLFEKSNMLGTIKNSFLP